jgi:hypothetical protein
MKKLSAPEKHYEKIIHPRKKHYEKIYIQKAHEKWSIFLFLLQPLNRCSFREDCVWSWRFLKNLCITTKTWTQWKFVPESIKVVYWRENLKNLFVFHRLTKTGKKIWIFASIHTTCIDSGTNFRHRQERDGTIVQTTHEHGWQEQDDNCACNSLHHPVLVRSCYCVCRIFTVLMFSL